MNFNSADHSIQDLKALLSDSRRIVIFTGAGISTESGIPDFRSPNGIWSKKVPIQFDEFVSSEQARREDWRRRFVMNEEFAKAVPNDGHRAIAKLAEQGKVSCVITQNIDGMHQKSGLSDEQIIEIHGNSTYGSCLTCEANYELSWVKSVMEDTGGAPVCPKCGGHVKAAVISFGQPMPQDKLQRAITEIQSCDLFIVLGSSLVVYPAARLPEIAKDLGVALVIVNRDPTPLDSRADLCIHDEIGPTMRAVM